MMGGQAESMGQLSELTCGFSEMGLSKDMIGQFIPTILSHVQEHGGDNVRGILEKIISPGN